MTPGSFPNDRPVRVAFDALSDHRGPAPVVAAAVRFVSSDQAAHAVLVGPERTLRELLTDSAATADRSRVSIVNADEGIPSDADPVAVVRARRGCSARVCADLVSRGAADATVSAASAAGPLAAATFVLGRLRGVTRPALAVVLVSPDGPTVLLDVWAGSGAGCTADVLAQHALAGAAYSEVLCEVPVPRVGLLSAQPEAADAARSEADALLAALPVHYVGMVAGRHLARGGRADVVVTDGFTGAVALSVMEGAAPQAPSAGMLVGVKGVSVVARRGADERSIAAAASLAVDAVRRDLVPRLTASLESLVMLRRRRMGVAL